MGMSEATDAAIIAVERRIFFISGYATALPGHVTNGPSFDPEAPVRTNFLSRAAAPPRVYFSERQGSSAE